MKLLNVIRIARNTTLKNLSEVDKTDEVLVDYVNLATLNLYKRFTLKTEEAIISLETGDTQYVLDGTDPDVNMPAGSEVMQITSAYDEKGRIGINNDVDPLGIYLIDYKTVQVPIVTDNAFISLLFKPYPIEIVYETDIDDNTIDKDIELPRGAIDCLLNYIGYLAYDSVDNGSGDSYLQKYEFSCSKLIEDGVVPQETYIIDVNERGFI